MENEEPTIDDNSIYAVAGRIQNHCSLSGLTLNSQGTALCNTFTHCLMSFYKFSDSLCESDRDRLITLIRKQEEAASNFLLHLYKGKNEP